MQSKKEKKPPSQSQKLRAVLFIHWEHYKTTGTFEEYYEEIMEKIINHVKSKIL